MMISAMKNSRLKGDFLSAITVIIKPDYFFRQRAINKQEEKLVVDREIYISNLY